MRSPHSTEGPNLETLFVIGPESRFRNGCFFRQFVWRDFLIIASSTRIDGNDR